MKILLRSSLTLAVVTCLACGEDPRLATGDELDDELVPASFSCGSVTSPGDRLDFGTSGQKVCMAVYAWPSGALDSPKRSGPGDEVDACWKGAHITMAGFKSYTAGEGITRNSEHLHELMTQSAQASGSKKTWHVQDKVYKSESPSEDRDGRPCPNGPIDDKNCYLRFDKITGVQNQSGSLELVHDSLGKQKFLGLKPLEQTKDGKMGLHLTIHKNCHAGSPCYERLERDVWTSGDKRLGFLLGPVVIDLAASGLESCDDVSPSYCPTRVGKDVLRFCHNMASETYIYSR